MLTDFPVFALNDDYLKALGIIIQDKINILKGIINDFEEKVELHSKRYQPKQPEQKTPLPPSGRQSSRLNKRNSATPTKD